MEVDSQRAVGFLGSVAAELGALRHGFSNWPTVAARIAVGRVRGRAPALSLCSRLGPVIQTPAGDSSWRTITEVFGFDCYKLEQMTLPPAPVFVDCGANFGAFALGMLARFPLAHGACYEPSPHAYAVLAANLLANDPAQRLSAHRVAVVGKPGVSTVKLFERPSDSCTSTLVPYDESSSNGGGSLGQWVEVTAQSLQAVLSRPSDNVSPTVDVLKIDVEGAEYDMITETPPVAFAPVRNAVIEYHHVAGRTLTEIAEVFAEAGFVWRRQQRSAISGQGLCWWERPPLAPPR